MGALHKARVTIVAGSDARIPGHDLHRELELLMKAGLTPMEAIQAATVVPAQVMKLDKELGTIQLGKRADLIIVEVNPLENIGSVGNVKTVIKDGRMYATRRRIHVDHSFDPQEVRDRDCLFHLRNGPYKRQG